MPPGLGEELQALRQMRLSAEQRRRRVLVSFWGFGGRAARDSWLRSLCCALRTEDVYCSDVAAGRFEGVVGVFRRQLGALEVLVERVKMGMQVLELVGWQRCMWCETEAAAGLVMACVSRIEGGSGVYGRHPSQWGGGFKEVFARMQVRANVRKVTGVECDANNMMMLYMAQQAAEHGMQYYKALCAHLRREREQTLAMARRADMLQRENSRMLFEMQRALTSGAVDAAVFHMVVFGDVRSLGDVDGQEAVARARACI